MKYVFFFFLVYFTLIGFFGKGYGLKSDEYFKKSESIFSKVVGTAGRKIAKKYKMHAVGIGGSENDEGISLVSLTFERHQGALSKEIGRRMVIEIIDTLIKTINTDKEIRPFLKNYPFEAKYLEILIINSTIDNDDLFDPDIEVFSLAEEEIGYFTRDPDNSYQYKSKVFESYSEALEIVKNEGCKIAL